MEPRQKGDGHKFGSSRLAVPVSYEKTPQEQLQVYVAMQLLRPFMHLPEFMIRQDALIRLL